MVKSKKLFASIYVYLILFLMYLPILVLIAFSFTEATNIGVWTGFSFKWYAELFQDSSIINSFYTTLLVSILAAAIATILGTLAAVGLHNMRKRWRAPVLAVNNIPLINADIVTGVSLCLLFVALGNALKFFWFICAQ